MFHHTFLVFCFLLNVLAKKDNQSSKSSGIWFSFPSKHQHLCEPLCDRSLTAEQEVASKYSCISLVPTQELLASPREEEARRAVHQGQGLAVETRDPGKFSARGFFSRAGKKTSVNAQVDLSRAIATAGRWMISTVTPFPTDNFRLSMRLSTLSIPKNSFCAFTYPTSTPNLLKSSKVGFVG